MGERKGTNKYYPPDYDPNKGGLNKFMGTHALRERARKLHLGILIIRFEMPYNIWCEGCNNHIGMGVRYNAEKKKVGMYYSTPVYEFRMKCHLCDNHFEMRTDPGNLDYIIMNGARRQENRWDPTENGQVVPDDKSVGRALQSNAMFKLEHGAQDQGKLKNVTPVLANLEVLQERWKDDYLANKIMRHHFRTKKKEIKAEEEKDRQFLQKSSLDIPLLKESEDDSRIAGLIRLQPSQTSEERQQERRLAIEKKSQFPVSTDSSTTTKELKEKSLEKVERQRASLGIAFGLSSKRALPSTTSATAVSPSPDAPLSSPSLALSDKGMTAGIASPPSASSPPQVTLTNSESTQAKNHKNGLSLISGDYGSSSSDESM